MNTKQSFPADPNQVWQIPNSPQPEEETTLVGSTFSDRLMATEDGIVAKEAFVFAMGKHPLRNIFVFYRREIGDVTYYPDHINPHQVERQDWMEKTEEDALAEIESRADDPATESQETLLESILGFKQD